MMKTKILIVLGLLATMASCDVRRKDAQAATNANSSSANTEPAEKPAPTTVQLIDSVYDFGTILEGQVVEYSFRFKNTGTKPLVVENVSASCGCTVADKPEQPIMPGEVGYIKAKFNSDHRVGEAHKTVTVTANAEPAFPQLLIKGNVKAKGTT